MAKTPEKIVKDKVVLALEEMGAYYFFPATGGYGRSGVPDIVACLDSTFIGIECKAGRGKPTALQLRELQRIASAGGVSIVIDDTNVDSVIPLIRSLLP